jgi:hypothetical protein
MNAGADTLHTTDNVSLPVKSEPQAVASAAAEMSSKDSNLALSAMRNSTDTASQLLPAGFEISYTPKAPEPTASESKAPSETAAEAPKNSSADTAQNDAGMGMPKMFSDMQTNDPTKAAQAAETYFEAIYGQAPKEDLKGISNGFHAAHGDVEGELNALQAITPMSETALNALGKIIDAHANAGDKASQTRDLPPMDGGGEHQAAAEKGKEDGTEPMPKMFSDMQTNDPKIAAQAAETYFNAIFTGMPKEMIKDMSKQFHAAKGNVEAEEEAVQTITPMSATALAALGKVIDAHAK